MSVPASGPAPAAAGAKGAGKDAADGPGDAWNPERGTRDERAMAVVLQRAGFKLEPR